MPKQYTIKILAYDMTKTAFRGALNGIRRLGKGIKNKLGDALSFTARWAKRATYAFVGLNTAALKVSANAQEMQNRLELAFGKKRVQGLEDWAAALSKATGRSKVDIKGILADIGIFSSTQFAKRPIEEFEQFAKKVAQLTIGIDSLLDVPTSRAFEAIRSGMSKMIRPLRRLGVNLSDITLKQHAFEQGMIRTAKSPLEGRKRYEALLSFIKQELPDAMDDAQRTIGSLANRFKQLQGAVKDLGVVWGNRVKEGTMLANVFKNLSQRINDFSNNEAAMDKVSEGMEKAKRLGTSFIDVFKNMTSGKVEFRLSLKKFTGDLDRYVLTPIKEVWDNMVASEGWANFKSNLLFLAKEAGYTMAEGLQDGMKAIFPKLAKFMFANKSIGNLFHKASYFNDPKLMQDTGITPKPYVPSAAKGLNQRRWNKENVDAMLAEHGRVKGRQELILERIANSNQTVADKVEAE